MGYPEQHRIESILFKIHEQFEEVGDSQRRIKYPDLGFLLIGKKLDVMPVPGVTEPLGEYGEDERKFDEAINLFSRLVKDGYIEAEFTEFGIPGVMPWVSVYIRGLTDKGKRFIYELPTEFDELSRRLEEVRILLEKLEPKDRQRGKRILDELSYFIRDLPPSLASEILGKLILPE